MRSCDEMIGLISARLDGELSPPEEAELLEHLRHCAACGALWEDLSGLHRCMPGLNVEPPPDLLRGVMDQIRQETPAPVPFPGGKAGHPRGHKWRAWGATAAALAVALLGMAVLRLNGGGARPGEPLTADHFLSEPSPRDGGTAGGGDSVEPAEGYSLQESAGILSGGTEGEGKAADTAVPKGAARAASEAVQDGAAPPEAAASAPPLAAMSGEAPEAALTEQEALQLLYEEQLAQEYPDAELTWEDGSVGYILTPMAPVSEDAADGQQRSLRIRYWGTSEGGSYYIFLFYHNFIDVKEEDETRGSPLQFIAVPASGEGETLWEFDGGASDAESRDASSRAFWAAVNE